MKYLRNLSLSLTVICALAASAFAGDTPAPPCIPGELQGPPCAAQSVTDDSTDPGELLTPPAQPTVSVTAMAEAVLWALSLF